MIDDAKFTEEALESLRFEGDPDPALVQRTRETMLRLHGRETRRARFGQRLWISTAFVAALGLGAAAGPRVLEWWEHVHLVTDEELPDGSHHVVLEDDEGNTILDDTLEPDEALFQIQDDEDGGAGEILKVRPEAPPEDGAPTSPR